MANSFNIPGRWRLDTAHATDVIFGDDWRGALQWVVEGGADGNSCVVRDKDNNIIWEAHHDGTRDQYQSDGVLPHVGYFRGLRLTTLDAGTLYIYHQ